MSITYPLDLSGRATSNKIVEEVHTVNGSAFKDYFLLVPYFAPFFVDDFKMTINVDGEIRTLVEDVDYSFTLHYVAGTRTTGKVLYGGVTLHNLDLNGVILVDYQTLGGDDQADRVTVLQTLMDRAYNPRTTIWENVSGIPCALPPLPHYQDYDDFKGQEAVVDALHEIAEAILNSGHLTREKIRAFLEELDFEAFSDYLKKSGDSMSGTLHLVGAPSSPTEAVNLGYLEDNYVLKAALYNELALMNTSAQVDQFLNNKVSKTGDTMTGFLTLNADPQEDLHPATKVYVDQRTNSTNQEVDTLQEEVLTLQQRVSWLENNTFTKEEVIKLIYEQTTRDSLGVHFYN